ncbi:MAG: restriction endonuclease subunit S [Alphaproteobacteria bacterium]|nr:restriction endonuclease subunit S [Alphaproteobacteria bacterium]
MNWPKITIDEITEVVTKGTTPTTYGMPFTESGVNFIKAEALNGDSSLDISGFTYVDETTHEALKRSILHDKDVLLTIAGAQVGRCGLVRNEHLPANTNQAVGIMRVNKAKADARFVYYHFKNPRTFQKCQGLGGQAAQPNINLTVLKGFLIQLPDLRVQRQIADILSAYDDLIEKTTDGGLRCWRRRRGCSTVNGSSTSASPATNTSRSSTASPRGGSAGC